MWMLKSVKPTQAGWYATWSEQLPNMIWPRFYRPPGTIGTMDFLPVGWLSNILAPDDDFDMWCPLAMLPNIEGFHRIRAFVNAKMN